MANKKGGISVFKILAIILGFFVFTGIVSSLFSTPSSDLDENETETEIVETDLNNEEYDEDVIYREENDEESIHDSELEEPEKEQEEDKDIKKETTPQGQLTAHYIDVGQGDAILLKGEDFTILIDAGRHMAK